MKKFKQTISIILAVIMLLTAVPMQSFAAFDFFYITIDELDKVELKVGQIKEVNRVEKSDKLYKLSVDVGEENLRTIVSGLVPFYKEEELLNKQVVVVTNLKPAKLRGVESNGMILAAGDYDVVKLLTLDNNASVLENGSNIH